MSLLLGKVLNLGKTAAAKNFALPLELVTQTVAILAKRGVGKTYTAAVMAEEMLAAGQQVVVIDPTGAWWGLRSSADGKGEGFPIVVLGGDHGDVPLEEHAGELIAQAIVERRFSAILDLSLFRKGQALRFMTPFAETLYRLNRQPVHLMIDEADAVAPQKCMGENARLLGAMEDLVRRGRKRGIGCTLISQRPAVLNKNVLTQCEMLVAMRLGHPKDINAVMEWINVHADPNQAKDMLASLPSLPIGTGWFWSPGWGDIFQRVEIRRRKTFDSSATPKPGQAVRAPKKLAAVDVQALGKQIADLAEEIKANNPAELKRQVADLKHQLQLAERKFGQKAPRTAGASSADPAQIARCVDQAVARRDQEWQCHLDRAMRQVHAPLAGLAKTGANLAQDAQRLLEALPTMLPVAPQSRAVHVAISNPRSRPALPPQRPQAIDQAHHGDSGNHLPKAERRILAALAQHGDCSKRKAALLAGYAVSGGGFNNALGRCRSSGWIEGSDPLTITPGGVQILGAHHLLPAGRELIDFWMNQLAKAEGEIFGVLVEVWPQSLSKEQIAARTPSNYEPSGGGFSNAVSRLRTLELIEGRGDLRLAPELGELL